MPAKNVRIDWKSFRWSVVLPLIMVVYVLAYIDRVNISFAMSGVSRELGMTASVGGLITGVFFIGYTMLQLPAGHWASRSSARRNVMVLSILWATFSALQGCVHSITQLVVVRFLLGTVEGGMFPSMVVLVANWFPSNERGRASGMFAFYLTLAPLIMSPVSGLILGHVRWFGLASWRWLFILEALPGMLVAILLYCLIADNPQSQKNLKPEERRYLVAALAEEAAQPKTVQDRSYLKAALHPSFVFLTLGFFFRLVGNYGNQIWMPTIVKGISGFSDQTVGFILAVPWLAGTFGLFVTGWITDRYDCKKSLAFIEQVMAGLAFLGLYFYGASNVWISLALFTVAVTGVASVTGITTPCCHS
jgi:sugar phosphate permease